MWLFGGKRKVGKVTSSVVVFQEWFNLAASGGECRVRRRCLPAETYDFDRGRQRNTDMYAW